MANFAGRKWPWQLSWCIFCAGVAGMVASEELFAQAVERPDLSIELIDPKVLRVCADPHNMPFSTDKGEGFENKLAELFAQRLDKGLSYTWYPQAPGFVRNTLAAHKCDAVMGVPQGDDLLQVTNPYYRTAYALVFKQGRGPEGVETLRPPSQGQAYRCRGRNAPRQQHGGQWPDGQCEALPVGRRYPRRFLGGGYDA